MTEPAELPPPPPSMCIFVCGRRGSGKTEFIRRHFLGKLPRVLIVDQTGEWERRGFEVMRGYGQVVDKLKSVAREPRWKFSCYMQADEVSELSRRVLVPESANIYDGYASRIGGMALYLDEVDLLLGQGSQDQPIRNFWQRGRHAGLTILAATQRPGNANVIIRSQSDWLVTFRLHDRPDIDYLQAVFGRDRTARVLQHVNKQYHGYLYSTTTYTGYLLYPDGRTTPDDSPQGEIPI